MNWKASPPMKTFHAAPSSSPGWLVPGRFSRRFRYPTGQQITTIVQKEEVRRLYAEEVEAFLRNDMKKMARLWSDDLVVTNPLNKFVNKQQVLGMVKSGLPMITAYDRQIEYLRFYGDTAVAAGTAPGAETNLPSR